ncbi:MAG: Dihydrofolate reductase [Alphaproteobacteria bacterium]|jgi:dihydrofolate reductase|nr:Dihydrofolate reductase [Alphaproteobacteria bacterium]
MDTRKIVGLIACDPRGVIGNKGICPWSYPEELEHFRRTTFQRTMIMGRKTFESIPPATLKERFNIVFSKKYKSPFWVSETVVFVSSLKDFLELTDIPDHKEMFLIGGAQIADLFFSTGLVSEMLLTRIHKPYEGDTIFPLGLLEGWGETILKKEESFTIYHYTKPEKIYEN